jgi:hypothetical protein
MRRGRLSYRYLKYLKRASKELWRAYQTQVLLRWIEEEAKKMRESGGKRERAERALALEDEEDGFPW